ncbi:hypothetical protein [Clostridium perfringens]|uniref:Uncharacterized protein n=1 Tax=Clostridium perfringens TaxID=1502 RepID=A0AAP4A8L4_CLOPF|nr:hypothetical protein [Clostridium perfringens]MDH2337029.1 hypothetical protein [Clostridium perfringens]
MENKLLVDYLEIINIFEKLKKENKNIFIQIKDEMLKTNNKTCK